VSKKISLPSGAILEITVSPFGISKALYMAMADEAKALKLDPKAEVDVNFFKDLFCSALASKKIETALDECMKRALYNGLRISSDTFEPVQAREDYFDVCYEVARENVYPFLKGLSARYSDIIGQVASSLNAGSKTTNS
jgi:hypothetical protein